MLGAAAFTCRHDDDWSAANGEFRCPAEIDDTPTLFYGAFAIAPRW